ncbi:FecR domain-containing protein [Pseudomonas mangiferae]|uniref:DUF4880 domain-containing protein n=1 Tax=Pseudomonas mangiferae TaxID=2593654 RepID=A0A553GWF1_9PSED|nr:FecR domain-containing protein [Pseudomonas mangiferae]TRX73840.1 DUF4880 domain-containing protein [Pseudomonas mangiferae]
MNPALAEAVDWYVRLHDSAADDATRAGWRAWLASDPCHAQAWSRIERLQQRLGGVPAGVAAATFEQARSQRRTALKALALLAGLGLASWQGYRLSPWSTDYATGFGERRRVTLPDGSRLDLASDSRVDVRFDGERRLVLLRRGELLLETAKDPRPLSVETAEGQILALGTRFGVHQDDGLTRVMVEAHAVEVRPRRATQRATRVDAGQVLVFGADAVGPLGPLPPGTSAWTEGMLVAVDRRLEDVLAELARYRPGYLGCSAAVADLRLSGAFALDEGDAALASLEDALPVRVRHLTRYWVRVEARDA